MSMNVNGHRVTLSWQRADAKAARLWLDGEYVNTFRSAEAAIRAAVTIIRATNLQIRATAQLA